jgi:hypothetical protein
MIYYQNEHADTRAGDGCIWYHNDVRDCRLGSYQFSYPPDLGRSARSPENELIEMAKTNVTNDNYATTPFDWNNWTFNVRVCSITVCRLGRFMPRRRPKLNDAEDHLGVGMVSMRPSE